MLDIKFIRENPEIVRQAIADKHVDLDLNRLLEVDKKLLQLKQQTDEYLTRQNKLSSTIAAETDKEAVKRQAKEWADLIARNNEIKRPLDEEFRALMAKTPTIPMATAPKGKGDADNVVIKTAGQIPAFDFDILDHVDIMEANRWWEPKVARVCGTRLVALKGELMEYEMALWQFALHFCIKKGFTPLSVPALTFSEALFGTGFFPFETEQIYELPKDNQYLVGTAEPVLNAIHAGEILQGKDLPILYTGFSPCFRRESGAAGKDTRGLYRVHQFYKVEQYIICKNDGEESAKWHQFLLNNTEEILAALELPYQIVECCTGDMGVGKYRMNDVETWRPCLKKYGETHSCSTLLDWQARRTNLRYRDNKTGKVMYAHTLNNTGLATPRIFVALLENHQQADGRISIPKAVRPYMGGREFIGKKFR